MQSAQLESIRNIVEIATSASFSKVNIPNNASVSAFLSAVQPAVTNEPRTIEVARDWVGNLEKIQTQYLPTRMIKQISTRIKNLTYRRAPSNPVKDFMTRTGSRLSPVEENILVEAHKICDGNWRVIKDRYLPKYPVAILQRLWTELNCEDSNGKNRGHPNTQCHTLSMD